jgi:salicylate hydroxylase
VRIVIIGAGIGGLATAAALRQHGFEATIYEQASELGEVGAGIQMTPNATKVLTALGLADRLRAVAFEPEAIVGLDWKSGREAFRTPLKGRCDTLYGAGYFQVHRADLHQMLRDSVPADWIRVSSRCVGLENTDDGVRLSFEDGSVVEADVVVGADGIHSVVRGALFEDSAPLYTGNICWRALVPFDTPDFDLVLPTSSMWFGPKGHVVTYYVRGSSMVNIVAVHETDSWQSESWTTPSSREELCATYADWHPRLRRLLERTGDIFKWGLFDRDPMATWTVGRVTLLGDAAHPMLPFLSQGAAMAIEDGYVLARALSQHADDVLTALRVYETERLPRTRDVQLAARERGRSYHMTSPVARIVRDVFLWVRSLFDAHSSGLRAAWVYDYDAVTTPLGDGAPTRSTP